MDKKIENRANLIGNFLVKIFHYLALFAIGSAIVWSAFFAFMDMTQKGSASIEDILLQLSSYQFFLRRAQQLARMLQVVILNLE